MVEILVCFFLVTVLVVFLGTQFFRDGFRPARLKRSQAFLGVFTAAILVFTGSFLPACSSDDSRSNEDWSFLAANSLISQHMTGQHNRDFPPIDDYGICMEGPFGECAIQEPYAIVEIFYAENPEERVLRLVQYSEEEPLRESNLGNIETLVIVLKEVKKISDYVDGSTRVQYECRLYYFHSINGELCGFDFMSGPNTPLYAESDYNGEVSDSEMIAEVEKRLEIR